MNQVAEQMGPKTLLVGIANPETMPHLMTLAGYMAASSDYSVSVTHVVVPENASEHTIYARRTHKQAEELLAAAARCVEPLGVGVDAFVEEADDVLSGLVSAAQVDSADLLLMGYSDHEPGVDRQERAFDRLVHRVARRVRCDMVVAKVRREAMSRVLVPIACGENLPMTGLLARSIVENAGAEVRFVQASEPGANPEECALMGEALLREAGLDDFGYCDIIHTKHPNAAIVDLSNQYDVTIVGTPRRPTVTEAVFGTRAERIASQSTSTVLIVSADRPA